MTDKYLSSINEMTQSISIDPSALLTTSTINALHFPDLTTSGISDSGGGRLISLNLDGVGMCESMTESFYEAAGQDETILGNNSNGLQTDTSSMTNSLKNIGKKDSINTQKKRRSRKAQYDAVGDGVSFDKIETVHINDEHTEPDETWLFQIPGSEKKPSSTSENIFSWVHKEFKENDINATKHRLLCKLDDMSHARTIRSVSCHNFAANQRSDSVKRSSTEQQVNPELVTNGRTTSPLRSTTPLFNGNGNTRPTSPASSSPHRYTIGGASPIVNNIRSRDASREREREPLDYTDLEVIAKVQLENLRQAERQGPLSKRFGGSSNTLLSTDSRDVSPSSVFGATRNTSPVGNNGYLTPRRSYSPSPAAAGRLPLRKNSFVVTESQYTYALPSVSPRSGSPAVKTGYWSGRVTPSALETCLETSFISTNNPLQNLLLSNNADNPFADCASGGSNISLASTSSTTSINMTNQSGTKPPVVPKSTIARNGVKPNNHRRSNTQTISTNIGNSYDLPDATESKPAVTNRPNVGPATNNRTRPPVSRPLQAYRGSQTAHNNNNTSKAPITSPSALKPGKKPSNELGSTFTAKQLTSNENNLLNDVSNKPVRSQVGLQRRTQTQSSVEPIPSSLSSVDMTTTTTTPTNGQTSIPRSSSSLSQGRKSGIPTIGKQPRPSIPTAIRPTSSNVIPTSQSSDNMMVTRNIRAQAAVTRPQIPDSISPTSSWNEGCY